MAAVIMKVTYSTYCSAILDHNYHSIFSDYRAMILVRIFLTTPLVASTISWLSCLVSSFLWHLFTPSLHPIINLPFCYFLPSPTFLLLHSLKDIFGISWFRWKVTELEVLTLSSHRNYLDSVNNKFDIQ